MAKLLMLKEYLELDDDGFVLGVGVTTIRSLLDAELRRESAMSKAARGSAAANGNALGKFAAAIKARCLPSSSRPERATFSAFSCKKKKKENKAKQRLTEDQNPSASVGWQSLRLPSPVISSRPSNCSYAASPAPYCLQVTSSTTGEERKEHSPPLSSSSQPSRNEEATSTITAALSPATEFDGREVEESAENKSNDEDEKVRASLVSVIDYTNKKDRVDEEEDEEESFYRSLENIERATEQLLHRIRRFEMLAELDLPMERCSSSPDGDDDVSSHAEEEEEEEEERAWELLGRLKANAPRGGGEKLLLDFFVQGGEADGGLLPTVQRRRQGATVTTTTEMLRTARRWIDGPPGAEAEEDCCHGEVATLREMERNGRWRCFHEEEDELILRFGDAMLQLLVEELVKELASQL